MLPRGQYEDVCAQQRSLFLTDKKRQRGGLERRLIRNYALSLGSQTLDVNSPACRSTKCADKAAEKALLIGKNEKVCAYSQRCAANTSRVRRYFRPAAKYRRPVCCTFKIRQTGHFKVVKLNTFSGAKALVLTKLSGRFTLPLIQLCTQIVFFFCIDSQLEEAAVPGKGSIVCIFFLCV